MLSEDDAKWRHLFLYLAYECRDSGTYFKPRGAGLNNTTTPYQEVHPVKSSLAAFRRRIDEAVYHATPSVWAVETITSGVIPSRPA
jgi:hypothetical protein